MKFLYPYRLLFLLLISAAMLFNSCVTEDDPPAVSLAPGDICPQFAVTLSDGTAVTTADLAGHTTLLLFFDTDCPDCRALLPVVQQVYTTLGSPTLPGADSPADGFTPVDAEVSGDLHDSHLILAISRAQAAPAVLGYWAANSLTLPVSPQSDRAVYDLFASNIIPRIYIISPSLTITHAFADSPLPAASTLLTAMGQ